jgi:DNA-binding CsgD family transcriptional regulator
VAAVTDAYTVTAKRWTHGWELHIDGVGVTQTGTLSKAEAVAREYISFALDIEDENSFDVDVVPQLDSKLAAQVKSARAQVRDAERKQREAAAKQREVAKNLGKSGLSGREIAAVLGMTPQRVSQLIGKSAARTSVTQRKLVARTSVAKGDRVIRGTKTVAGRRAASRTK